MRVRQLGRSGLVVSEVGLGCNNFGGRLDEERSREVIRAAIDAGITLFDTADIYGGAGRSEEIVGRAVRGMRDEVVLATKFGMDAGLGYPARGSRVYVMRALERSLRRLGTDWIDLYQFHEPDPLTPIEETLSALDDAVRQGKVRYLGSSNFTSWQAVEAELIARQLGTHRFVSAQNHYNLLERQVEAELLPVLGRFGIGLLPYYPLASGLLTGKFRRATPPPAGTRLASRPERLAAADWERLDAVGEFARSRGMGLLDLAFAFLLARPVVASVIAGATSPTQVQANVATQQHRLSEDDLAELEGLLGTPGTVQ
jgi:aryl-alcohol dehydrogenase-like predicted oxidoreductase